MIAYPHYRSLRHKLALAGASCLLVAGICHAALTYSQITYAQPVAPAKQTVIHTAAPITTTLTSAITTTTSKPASRAAVAVTPNCQSNTSYGLPSSLDLSNAAVGLTEVTDDPVYYNVYGISATAIGKQLLACAPHFAGSVQDKQYLAYTSYKMSWQYDTLTQAGGLCSVTNVKVGQHSSQIFPRWNSAATAPSTVTNKWNSFASDLRNHENGHLTLNNQYAQQLLTQLQAIQNVPCASVGTIANSTIQANILALNAAHLQHDAATSYGASEGATWAMSN